MDNIFTVTMPDIGEGVIEAEVIKWLKTEGETLTQDEPVVVVMTDKATVELPAPHPGKLLKQYYKIGDTAILDKPIYDIVVEGKVEAKVIVKPKEEKTLATPKVRKLAKEMNIDINTIQGTGKDGMVTEEDLQKHTAIDKKEPIIGIKALMAKRMVESKKNIPHFSYFEQVEVSQLIELRENLKKDFKLSFMPLFIKALSLTIAKFPSINSSIDTAANKLVIHEKQGIGVAMSTELGLIVPVIKNVEKLSLKEIIAEFNDLKNKAGNGKLKPQEMKDSTITISNYGALSSGGKWATPIINFPESAILAMNRIQKAPIVKDDQILIGSVLNLSWSFDHRIIDGDLASRVSDYFANLLKDPGQLRD